MDVQEREVAGAQRHQVAVGAQVGLQVGDRAAVPADREDEVAGAAGLDLAGERDLVAVHLGGGRGFGQRLGRVVAGHAEVGAQHQALGVGGGHEVGEDPVGAGVGEFEVGAPHAVVVHGRVQVLVAGHVAADHDEVHAAFVGGGELGDRPGVGADDPEGEFVAVVGLLGGRQHVEPVAGLRDAQAGRLHLGRRGVVGPVGLGGVGDQRVGDPSGAQRPGERHDQREAVDAEPAAGVHVSPPRCSRPGPRRRGRRRGRRGPRR